MGRKKDAKTGANWVELLNSWQLPAFVTSFRQFNLTDPFLWCHFTEDDLNTCGLKEDQRKHFKKQVDQWTRRQWEKESAVQIYSQSRDTWFDGTVVGIQKDEEGEWLTVRYNNRTSKQVQRFCEDIRSPPLNAPLIKPEATKPKHRPRSQSVSIDSQDLDIKVITDLTQNQREAQQLRMQNVTATALLTRNSWKKDDYVEVYSRSRAKWLLGTIHDVGEDEEGEFLEVIYRDTETGQTSKKRLSRHDEEVRASRIEDDHSLVELPSIPSYPNNPVPPSVPFMDNYLGLGDIIPGIDDDDSDDYKNASGFPESPIAMQYRMRELSELRREVLDKEGCILHLQETIKELTILLNQEKRTIDNLKKKLNKEEHIFTKQTDILKRQARKKWRPGSFMEVYSNTRANWFLAECVEVFTDTEGEWLQVLFCDRTNDQTIMKQIQRYSNDLRPCQADLVPPITYPVTSENGLPKIHELPGREDELNEEWLEHHAEESEELSSPPKPTPTVPPQNDYRNLSRNRNQTVVITQSELQNIQANDDILYITYNNDSTDLSVDLDQSVGHLMQRISQHFNIIPQEQRLYYKNTVLDYSHKDEFLSLYNFITGDDVEVRRSQSASPGPASTAKVTRSRIFHQRAARGSTTDSSQSLLGGNYEDVMAMQIPGTEESPIQELASAEDINLAYNMEPAFDDLFGLTDAQSPI